MRPLSRRLAALFCLAVVGIAVVIGLVALSLAGPVGAVVYAGVALLLLGVAASRGRRLVQPPPQPPGRTCTCCTTSQHDPVQVI